MSNEELQEYIKECDAQYYEPDENVNNGMPLISDEEYDELMAEFLRRKLLGQIQEVPGGATNKFRTIHHPYTVKSLDKINTDVEVIKAIHETFPEGTVSPKIDGLTIVVYGEGTLPETANGCYVTRGNGTDGDDLSHSCSLIPGLKKIKGVVYRVEVYLPKSQLSLINEERIKNGEKPFENCRNAAAGIVRNLDTKNASRLKYFAYRILNSTDTHSAQLSFLANHGITIVPVMVYSKTFYSQNKIATMDQAIRFVTGYTQEMRDRLDYDIDGIVIQSNIPDSRAQFGETGHHPKDGVAYKFTSQGQWTVLKDVVWQVGRTGVAAPVGIYDPVRLLGSTNTRATLHNRRYMEALGLEVGSDIYVIKANDVIPRIAKRRDDAENRVKLSITYPDYCPVCQSPLTYVNDALYCQNTDCAAKVIKNISHMCKKECLNIEGLSSKTIEKLFDLGVLPSTTSLFDLTAADFLKCDGFAEASAKKMEKAIKDAIANVPMDRAIYACCIPGLGKTASKMIAKNYNSVHTFLNTAQHNLGNIIAIDGIGNVLGLAISNNIHHMNMVFSALEAHGTIVPWNVANSTPGGKTYNIVITGPLHAGTRVEYAQAIEQRGHKLQSSVTSSTDYLVTNETTMTTKRKAAMDKNIPIIGELELRKLIGLN